MMDVSGTLKFNPNCRYRNALCSSGINDGICLWHEGRKGTIVTVECECKIKTQLINGDFMGRKILLEELIRKGEHTPTGWSDLFIEKSSGFMHCGHFSTPISGVCKVMIKGKDYKLKLCLECTLKHPYHNLL